MASIRMLAAYAAGIFLAPLATMPVEAAFLLITSLLLTALWWRWRHSVLAEGPFLAGLLLLGFLQTTVQLSPPVSPTDLAHYADRGELRLSGRVLQVEPRWDGRTRVDLAIDALIEDERLVTVTGNLRVQIRDGTFPGRQGDRVRLRTLLERPRNFGTPGEFNYTRFLASRRIYVTARLDHSDRIVVLGDRSCLPQTYIQDVRQAVGHAIDRAVPPDEQALVKALVIGRKGQISPADRDWLSRAGVSHLFAISGLHFGLIGLLAYVSTSWLYRRSERLMLWRPPRQILPPLLLLPLAVYLVLSGNAVPAQRAYLMTGTAVLLFSMNRRAALLPLLAGAALLLLLINPLALFQPAFQLSFCGLLGILVWAVRWSRFLPNRPRVLRGPTMLLFSTLAATLATLPWSLWHFHQLAPAGPIVNLLAIPLIGWGAVPAGLLGTLLLPLSSSLAELLFALSGGLVALTRTLAVTLTEVPGLKGLAFYLTQAELCALLGLLAALMLTGARTMLWPRTALLVAVLALTAIPIPSHNGLAITAISVGQGDATLISFRDSHYLVDGGGWPGSNADPGERLVSPALGRLGIERLQGVILTHDHPDHRDGLLSLLRHLPAERFWSALAEDQIVPELRSVLKQRQIAIETLPPGWMTLEDRAGFQLQLFTPGQQATPRNERSIQVYAGNRRTGALLTADGGSTVLRQLLQTGLPGPVSLLKLPHHGSRNSSPGEYLETLGPSVAFVSAGHNNRYGHPHPQSVAECRDRQIPLWQTNRDGTFRLILDHRSWQCQPLAHPQER